MSVTKPLLRYHGSKWQIADWLTPFFPKHFTYVEPFGGGGAVLLRKQPSGAELYNDLDAEIANLFRVLRTDKEKLIEALYYTEFGRDAFYEAWDTRAKADEAWRKGEAESMFITDPVEAARITMMISYQSHTNAGVTRGSRSGWKVWIKPGWSQVPSDYWDTINERINEVAERLRRVNIENKPALDVIRQWDDTETLFYCDPPYIAETRKEGLGAYRHEMTLEDHRELAETLQSCKGMAIVSGYDNEFYRHWFKGWEMHSKFSQVEGRQQAAECIWISPNAQARREKPQLQLFGNLTTQREAA